MKQSAITILCLFWAVSTCVFADITYTTYLSGVDSSIASQIETAIAEAVGLYNKRGSFNKHLYVYYEPTVPTADGNYNGTIRFGGQRTPRVALHEISHTLGVGTYGTWWNYLSGAAGGYVWLGDYAIGQVEEFDGPGSVIYADGVHFWLYGLNYENEDNFVDRIRHIRMVANILCDLGLVSFAREPEAQAVQLGGTAIFNVVAANAASYAWYKEGDPVALTDGENISGATTDTLEIANVDARDDGYYYCVASGSLASRVGRLTVEHSELYDRSDFTIDDIRGSDPYEVGNKFVTGSNPPTITALGFIDLNNSNPATGPDGDGLLESHRVTLWSDSDGSKVTEVTVPAGTDGHLIDGFRYAEIPEGSLTLAPNTAYVVSADIAVLDPWLNEEYLIPNADFINENVDDSTTWEGRWGTQGQWPTSQWHTGTFYGVVNVSSEIMTPKFTLTIETEPNFINTVTPSVGQHEEADGTVDVSAETFSDCPHTWEFQNWVGDVIDPSSANTQVVMDSDKTITAVFADERRCGDECHPNFIEGDFNHDCIINMEDFAFFVSRWMVCTQPECD